MHLVQFLIVFPLFPAFAMLLLSPKKRRQRFIANAGSLVIMAAAVALLFVNFRDEIVYFSAGSHAAGLLMFGVEAVLAAYIAFISARARQWLVTALVGAQFGVLAWTEFFSGARIEAVHNLFIDKFSIIMALIIGVIGSLIVVYAVRYMREYHRQHAETPDRRKFFFFILFAFLSAMFGIVFSNNLLWLYFFWEITTLCSFFLIGYSRTDEAKGNAYRALRFNLLGGLGFALAICCLAVTQHTVEMDKVLALGKGAVLLPVALIAFAGLTKSAQFPFSSWLLGAMVAPTPVSALLHSSTMVKAGVYIVLRFAPVLQNTLTGYLIALVGAVTFLISSFIAIAQSDAKKVLAYSTVANLGLVILCAGIGTYEAMWAAVLLIMFHAVAKCLLFLCVGTVEHKIHSRNIEDMAGLIVTMPRISIMMQIGMAGMFLAPFGMLISKWAVLKALVDYNPLLAVFVIFGSSATLFFWVKWMGKLITVVKPAEEKEDGISVFQWIPLAALSGLTVILCGFFPMVSTHLIEPFVIELYGKTMTMSAGNILIMSIMLTLVMLFPLSFINYGKKVKVVDAYLGAANLDTPTEFRGALGEARNMEMGNYYLEGYFGEGRLLEFSSVLSAVLIVIMLLGAAFL